MGINVNTKFQEIADEYKYFYAEDVSLKLFKDCIADELFKKQQVFIQSRLTKLTVPELSELLKVLNEKEGQQKSTSIGKR